MFIAGGVMINIVLLVFPLGFIISVVVFACLISLGQFFENNMVNWSDVKKDEKPKDGSKNDLTALSMWTDFWNSNRKEK